MFCLTVPEALMTSSLPLKHHVSWLPFHDTAVSIVIDWGQLQTNLRLRRVGREVYAVDCDNVLIVGLGAELQRRVARDLEVIVNDDGLVSLNQDAGTGRRETGGEEGDDSCGEPHRG